MKREDKNILLSEQITGSVEWIIIKRAPGSLGRYVILLAADILFILFSLCYLVNFNG